MHSDRKILGSNDRRANFRSIRIAEGPDRIRIVDSRGAAACFAPLPVSCPAPGTPDYESSGAAARLCARLKNVAVAV